MSEIPPIWIMEPSPKEKRRRFSRTLAGRDIEPDLEAIRLRLRELREYSLREHRSLLEEFKSNITGYRGLRVISAYDAQEAVDYIAEVALGTENTLVNRSSLVTNELRPGLEKHGLKVIQPYYAEFNSFENKIRDYWDLPDLLRKGLTGAFSISSADSCLVPRHGETVRDCIAVLGVNAVSAKDCSIFFLQHFSNISRSLEQAREVIFVVGLDKLVKDKEDAAFQTRCMGIFGMESMLLNLRPRESELGDIDSLPSVLAGEGRAVHIVLLDNGRSRILGSGLEDLLLCIGCRACIKRCPINRVMSEDGAVWSPKDYLLMFLLDKDRSLDTCLHCEACRVECPVAIDIPKLMWMGEADYIARRGRSFRNRVLGNPELLARVGSLALPISNATISIEPGKTMVRMALGFDTNRRLPRFRHQTFKKWFARGEGGSRGPSGNRRLAYYVGCFADYYEPEIAQALVKVLERNGLEVLVPDQRCCGMPMMANKNMSGARKNAEYNIESLAAAAANGSDIVTACPSCSLMIKREYPNLYDSDEARLVSEHIYYVDEYLMLLNRRGELSRDLVEISESVFYHVPCHLKVQGLDLKANSLELLHLIPGLSIERVDAACCGMAGYHGYKKAHSDLSMEIGSKLFGEIGLAQADRVVTGCGACKLQIEAGTGARAMHPIILLQEAYGWGPYLS
jgi:anaerobic glycerol-3-phosphate dehydrogenase C subunit